MKNKFNLLSSASSCLFLKENTFKKNKIKQSNRGIFIFGGGSGRLRGVTKLCCQCQISHKRRKKECLGEFKFSLNRLKK
jgi:hypothetical protein